MKKIITLFVVLMLVACAAMDADGPKFVKHEALDAEKSIVYLFKPDSASSDGVTTCLALTLNGKEYGCVQGKGYVVAEVAPDNYSAALVNKASFGFKVLEFPLDLKAGEVTYLEYAFGRQLNGESLDTRFAGLGVVISGNHVVARINEAEALTKLASLALSK